jgi:ubiquitin carboxyl-terminal hydrolase MINDY-1/2
VPVNEEATLQKFKEQRNETYQIKHFNWFDYHTNNLRRSSMLTQNKNGPCPLLALVNALILSKADDSESALGNALRAREQVSLGLLIESLMDELTSESRDNALEELPDVDELNRFLLRLHTGMNANPRFVVPEPPPPNLMDARDSVLHLPLSINTDRKPGTFEQAQDLILYGAFAIPLVHGWLPQRSDPARAAFARAAPTYEDAQTIQFGEEELEIKLNQGGLTPNEQQLWEDIESIRKFFSTYPTQLTPYGLDVVSESLFPGAFAIMFRNDHFSTIYKHPETGQLYTLVTDAGYADKDEVIWESLVDVSGRRSEFFSGDFRPVGNVDEVLDSPSQPSNPQNSSSHLHEPAPSAAPISPQGAQEQHDADFAMALQLQEEEQARQQSANTRRRSTQSRNANAGAPPSNIPIRLRPADAGPAVPPRNQRSNPGVNRPSNEAPNDDAPPLYEEAVKGTPYIPPPGHPQHPASDPSPRASTSAITPVVSAPAGAPRPAPQRAPAQPPRVPQHQRRMSAYQEAQQYRRFDPDRPLTHNATMGLQGQPAGRKAQKEQDKDCVVM